MNNKLSSFLILSLLAISCNTKPGEKETAPSELPLVCAVNYPLHYFAQRIGGELIRAEFPAPQGVDPAYWIPGDSALALYQDAELILANGANYARWMNQVSLPSSRIINTTGKVKERYIVVKEGQNHSHGPEGDHVHTGYAFTTWLDLELAAEQAKAVSDALVLLLPEEKESLEARHRALEKDLLSLHSTMTDLAATLEGATLIGSHPVYQYLSRAYDLEIHSVHFEPGEMPSEKQWKEFDHLLDHHPSGLMLWEDEPLEEVKALVEKRGVKTWVFNPCGNRQGSGDLMEVMKRNLLNQPIIN